MDCLYQFIGHTVSLYFLKGVWEVTQDLHIFGARTDLIHSQIPRPTAS